MRYSVMTCKAHAAILEIDEISCKTFTSKILMCFCRNVHAETCCRPLLKPDVHARLLAEAFK